MRLYFRSIFAEKLLFLKLRIGDGYAVPDALQQLNCGMI